ncbi:MAG: helix-turn-helix domain-containing protein [Hyphomicrobiaceae bacterium]
MHILRSEARAYRSVVLAQGSAEVRPEGRHRRGVEAGPAGLVARAMLRDTRISIGEVARRLGVAPSTLYRHVPAARIVVTRGEPAAAPPSSPPSTRARCAYQPRRR